MVDGTLEVCTTSQYRPIRIDSFNFLSDFGFDLQVSRHDRGFISQLKPGHWFGHFDKPVAQATVVSLHQSTVLLVTAQGYEQARQASCDPLIPHCTQQNEIDTSRFIVDSEAVGQGSLAQVDAFMDRLNLIYFISGSLLCEYFEHDA